MGREELRARLLGTLGGASAAAGEPGALDRGA